MQLMRAVFVLKSFTLINDPGGGGGERNFHWKCCDRSKTKIQLIYMYLFSENKKASKF